MSGHRKNKALISFTVCISLLCLLQIACAPDRATDDSESNLIDPDEFALEVEEIYETRKTFNWITIKITPGSPSMCAEEFEVTACIVDKQGIVQGKPNECGQKEYTKNINSYCCVATLAHSLSKAKQDNQGQPITFWIKAKLNNTTQQNEPYILKVEVVVYKGSSREHTKTKSITLKAKQDGVDPKKQTEKENTSDTNASTSDTTLSKASGSTTPPINHPIPSVDLASATEEATTIEASTTLLGCDTDLPILPSDLSNTNASQRIDPSDSTTEETHTSTVNVKASGNDASVAPKEGERIPTASSEQRTEVSNITEDDSPSSTNTSAQQPAFNQLTVTLTDVTRSNSTKNFVLVTIQPSDNGMNLEDFFVTASLSDSNGSIKGSSGKKGNGFVYNNELKNCSLNDLFTSFTQDNAISFRIESKPGAATNPGDQYTLTVTVAYTGSHPHTETKSIPLTAPQASPSKGSKRTSSRK